MIDSWLGPEGWIVSNLDLCLQNWVDTVVVTDLLGSLTSHNRCTEQDFLKIADNGLDYLTNKFCLSF